MDYKKISEFEASDYISSQQYIPVAENGDNKKIKRLSQVLFWVGMNVD